MRITMLLWLWYLPAVVYSQVLQGAEYFFDHDPGAGLAFPLVVDPGPVFAPTLDLSIDGLGKGLHTFNLRVRDNAGKWSLFAQRLFYIIAPASASSLTNAEYFLDHDPGAGAGVSLTVTPGDQTTSDFAIPLDPSLSGFHRLSIRYADDRGMWSHFAIRTLFIMPLNTLPAVQLDRIEYFVDVDPGYGAGQDVLRIPFQEVVLNILVDLPDVPPGNHMLYIRARDNNGLWSEVAAAPFVVSFCEAPPPPTVSAGAHCGPGTVQLVATGASNFQRYRWYDDPVGGNLVSTSDQFETPELTSSRWYYVSIRDVEAACESARTPVLAEIYGLPPKPIITVGGSPQLCGDETVTLTGPPAYAQIWSTGEEVQSITLRSTATVTLVVQDAHGCLSEPSDPLQIERLVPEPVIEQEEYTLLAIGEASTFQWYLNGQPIQDAVDNKMDLGPFDFGVYAVEASLGGCSSRSSDYLYLITHIAEPHGNEVISVENPVRQALLIRNNSGQTAGALIVDGLGREVWRGTVVPGYGEQPAAFMASGMYYFIYRTASHQGVIKLAKP